jgi:thymidine kinase
MKIYFRYGTMDSSKTARLLMDANEYVQRGENPLLLKPVQDTRSKTGFIESRIGLRAPCVDVEATDNLTALVTMLVKSGDVPDCVFIDEAQFLTMAQVIQLRIVADNYKIPVMCYGLKTDFRGLLFDGSRALFENANRVEEVKTICREKGCKNKAMYNGRFKNGVPVFDGETVVVGDTAERKKEEDAYYYIPKCSVHFYEDFRNQHKGDA